MIGKRRASFLLRPLGFLFLGLKGQGDQPLDCRRAGRLVRLGLCPRIIG
jgi:hypothetical protein